jgi:formate hydrogenlyase subunit 3/multisubunit Na+/H+ antiporter MnhD subunit
MIDLAAIAVPVLLALGLVGLAFARSGTGRLLVYGGCVAVCLILLSVGLAALNAEVQRMVLPIGLPTVGCHLRLDALSAFFLALIGLGGAGASVFALGYARHESHPERVLPFYPVFLAGMVLVVLADDAFSFLFAWELMSLSSWALVMAHRDHAGTSHSAGRAGLVYLLMATFSGLMLLLAFSLLAGATGGFAFDRMRVAHPSPMIAAGAFLLALIGAGSKAGLVPLHVWLPLAHPAAPSHVSALMSGVMTKVAIYGFLRLTFDLLGPQPWWTAAIVLAAGGITAVLGVLQAMMERDLKRLLAYSTVENIGILFIGIGLALAFRTNGFAAGAALAITAALFHALNHTLFKSLLFFGAGAVLNATGERDMETMGGLIHRMPLTAFAFLAGCVAVSALPPMNGFASEWLTFQAVLLRPELPQWGLKLMFPVDGALLALAAALAAACFVRAFGISFLGRPRSTAAAQALEVDRWSIGAMLGFAGLCLLTGILPGVVIDAIAPLANALTGSRMPVQLHNDWLTIAPIAASRSSYNGLLVFGFITASILITTAVVHRLSRGVRRGPAWDCGFPSAATDTQYSAASFAQPIRRVFGIVFDVKDTVDMPLPGDNRPASITHASRDPVWDTIYVPLGFLVGWAAGQMNVLQFLTIRRYLGFVFGALVALLLTLALWQ